MATIAANQPWSGSEGVRLTGRRSVFQEKRRIDVEVPAERQDVRFAQPTPAAENRGAKLPLSQNPPRVRSAHSALGKEELQRGQQKPVGQFNGVVLVFISRNQQCQRVEVISLVLGQLVHNRKPGNLHAP